MSAREIVSKTLGKRFECRLYYMHSNGKSGECRQGMLVTIRRGRGDSSTTYEAGPQTPSCAHDRCTCHGTPCLLPVVRCPPSVSVCTHILHSASHAQLMSRRFCSQTARIHVPASEPVRAVDCQVHQASAARWGGEYGQDLEVGTQSAEQAQVAEEDH